MKNYSQRKKGLESLGSVNRIFIIIIIFFVGYIVIKYFTLEQRAFNSVWAKTEMTHEASTDNIRIMNVKPFQFYKKSIKTRNLFESLKNNLKPDTKVLQKALPALHKRIKLIGILVDSDSKAIVEDLREKQTHFLSKGESLGVVLLEDIREDKVIFKYDNERVEMTP